MNNFRPITRDMGYLLPPASYVSRHGHAFIDRALYLSKVWTDDPARLKQTRVPADIGFTTKPQMASAMIGRAIAAGVPFGWAEEAWDPIL